jgi:hypothetical protein
MAIVFPPNTRPWPRFERLRIVYPTTQPPRRICGIVVAFDIRTLSLDRQPNMGIFFNLRISTHGGMQGPRHPRADEENRRCEERSDAAFHGAAATALPDTSSIAR